MEIMLFAVIVALLFFRTSSRLDGLNKKIKELEKKSNDIRISIIEVLVEAGSGHTAGSLGMADIFTVLYFNTEKLKPKLLSVISIFLSFNVFIFLQIGH